MSALPAGCGTAICRALLKIYLEANLLLRYLEPSGSNTCAACIVGASRKLRSLQKTDGPSRLQLVLNELGGGGAGGQEEEGAGRKEEGKEGRKVRKKATKR